MSVRRMTDQAFALGGTAAQPCHVRLGRRLVDEDEPGRVERRLTAFPAPPGLGDIGPVLLGRMERLFLYVSPSLVSTQWMAPIVQPSVVRHKSCN
jgi:hypothetical protein